MAKVTYLLGAGASASSYPVVDEMEGAIGSVISRLTTVYHSCTRSGSLSNEQLKDVKTAIFDLTDLREGCGSHISVDTFLRKLYLNIKSNDRATYNKVKSSIVLFFVLYRFFEKKTDKRYDAFLAALLKEDTLKMPDDINIVSWNYDYEFERAYKNYVPELLDLEKAFYELNITYKNSAHNGGLLNRFGIVKLNGTAGYHNEQKKQKLGLRYPEPEQGEDATEDGKILWPTIENYVSLTYKDKWEPSISFAWDKDYGERKVKQEIVEALQHTEILVVIGYSFPYFNREIDRHIFNSLATMDQRGYKFYIQDPFNAETVIENIMGLNARFRKPNFSIISDKKQFYIPHEI